MTNKIEIKSLFPERLNAARKARKLSQVELAVAAGLKGSCIAGYERGTHTPSLESMCKLAEALKAPIGWLCAYEVIKKDEPVLTKMPWEEE